MIYAQISKDYPSHMLSQMCYINSIWGLISEKKEELKEWQSLYWQCSSTTDYWLTLMVSSTASHSYKSYTKTVQVCCDTTTSYRRLTGNIHKPHIHKSHTWKISFHPFQSVSRIWDNSLMFYWRGKLTNFGQKFGAYLASTINYPVYWSCIC